MAVARHQAVLLSLSLAARRRRPRRHRAIMAAVVFAGFMGATARVLVSPCAGDGGERADAGAGPGAVRPGDLALRVQTARVGAGRYRHRDDRDRRDAAGVVVWRWPSFRAARHSREPGIQSGPAPNSWIPGSAFAGPGMKAAYRRHPISTAPAAMRTMPSQFGSDGRSPRNSTANTATSTTLSLSMGATCDALPSLRARK